MILYESTSFETVLILNYYFVILKEIYFFNKIETILNSPSYYNNPTAPPEIIKIPSIETSNKNPEEGIIIVK